MSLSVSQVFGFIATIVFALDFYFIFNELANFLKDGGEANEAPPRQEGERAASAKRLIDKPSELSPPGGPKATWELKWSWNLLLRERR